MIREFAPTNRRHGGKIAAMSLGSRFTIGLFAGVVATNKTGVFLKDLLSFLDDFFALGEVVV
jgi:hypothetical protein